MNTSDDGKRGDSWWVEALNLKDTDLLHTYYCACIDLNRQFPLHFLIRVEIMMMKPKLMQAVVVFLFVPTGRFVGLMSKLDSVSVLLHFEMP